MKVRPADGPIVLVGLRGSGKSTLGRALAARLELPFVDLDDQVTLLHAALTGSPRTTPGALFGELGEPAFRAREWAALQARLGSDGPEEPCVLATGGGVVETAACRGLLLRTRCLWLRVPLDELARRLAQDPTDRPALAGDDPITELPEVAARRDALYREVAWRAVDLSDLGPGAAVDALLGALASPAPDPRDAPNSPEA